MPEPYVNGLEVDAYTGVCVNNKYIGEQIGPLDVCGVAHVFFDR